MLHLDQVSLTQYKGVLNGVFKLPDITRPGIHQHCRSGFLGDTEDLAAMKVVETVDEMINEQWNVGFSFRKGGQRQPDNIDTKK